MGIRLAVLDDNPHLLWEQRTYPANATFHRFLAAFLDLPGAPVAQIAHCVPLRPATQPPHTQPLDPRIEVAGTAPFDGIAGFLRHAPTVTRRNARLLGPVVAGADLLWLKLPASNGPLAAWLAWRAGVPRFGYVAGSARDVVRGQRRRALAGIAARVAAATYDVGARLVTVGGDRLVVGADLADGGIVTSLVESEEVRDTTGLPWPREAGLVRLAWAGRLAPGKGLETVLEALSLDLRLELLILGDGPARSALQERAHGLGVAGRIAWHGHVAERAPYLDALATADVFVFPSPAEGFPKVILDAMAVGLPIIASPAGALAALGDSGVFVSIPPGDPDALRSAIARLASAPETTDRLRRAGARFVAVHTRPAEATRLVARWRERYPELPWG